MGKMASRLKASFVLASLSLGFGVMVFAFGAPDAAAAFPDKPIHLIAPFSPGGGTDTMARMMQAVLTKEKIITVPIVVENKPGGSGAVGYDFLAGKRGNPYYLIAVTTQFFTNPLLKTQKATHDDFTFICQIAFDPNLVMVRSDYEYQTMKDLLDAAKANPGKIRWAGTGSTGSDRILSLMLEQQAGAKFNFVPFQSGGEVTTALLGKHVDIITNQMNESYAQIQAGKFKALAIGSEERSPYMKDLPTLIEMGTQIVSGSYRGVAAPAGLPDDARAYLEAAFKKLDASPMWQKEYIEKFQLQRKFRDGASFRKLSQEKLMPEYIQMFKAVGVMK